MNARPLKRFSARYLTTMTSEQLWSTLAGPFILVFDDGELTTNSRETLFSNYAWDFIRKYPSTPMLKHHHVKDLLGNRRLGAGTHLKLFGNVMWDVHDTYIKIPGINVDKLKEELAEMTYRLTNLLYNDLTYKCEQWVTSIDITDYVKILDHPAIKKVKAEATPTAESLEKIHYTVETALMTDPLLTNNPISKAVRSGLSNMGQVLQCVAYRGYISDTDSRYFKRPVMRSFAEGFRSFYDSFVEARHAAMAHAQAKDPLEQTEYFNRRLQLICQSLRNLHRGDCGSTEYLYWTMRDKELDGRGNLLRKSDLNMLEGKYFVNGSGGLSCISKKDKQLLGQTLKIRSVLHCAHPDPYGVCSTCFGQMSDSILDPMTGNLGQSNCTSMTEVVSQLVLSTKHFVGSAEAEYIVLDDFISQYLKIGPDFSSYLLNPDAILKGKHVRLVIPNQFAINFTDILEVKDVHQLTSTTRVSELPEIGIFEGDGVTMDYTVHKVSQDRRMASMTYALLEYIKLKGWTLNEKGYYVIEMSDWDYSQPILTLPMKRYNMSDHSAEIADILESSMKKMDKRIKENAVDPTLGKLFDHVNERLNVNLAVLEVVLYGGMIVSSAEGDYSFPKVGTSRQLGVMENTIDNRSAAAKFAYEHQLRSITSPKNYISPNRLDHPMDGLVSPFEVLQPFE